MSTITAQTITPELDASACRVVTNHDRRVPTTFLNKRSMIQAVKLVMTRSAKVCRTLAVVS